MMLQSSDILQCEQPICGQSLRLYEQLNKEAPADLLAHLASLESRRNKITCSSRAGSCQDDMRTDSDDYDVEDEESCDGMDEESSDGMDEESIHGSEDDN